MIPENLTRLREGEASLREESLRRIAKMPDMLLHLGLIEKTMDLIHYLLEPLDPKDKNGVALRMLSIRVFNGLAATLRLLFAGYYQASALQLRDVLETAFLLDFFTSDETLVAQWLNLPEKERRRKFGPAAVRKALDRRDRLRTGKRDAAYDMFCHLAAHPNPDSATMLIPVQGSTEMHYGPFLETEGLKAVLAETAVCAAQAAVCIRRLLGTRTVDHMRAAVAFIEMHSDWLHRIFDIAPAVEKLAELRELLSELEKRAAARRGAARPGDR